jgi:RNA polymerase sigma-70 factor (ECF subfamily)
MHDVSQDAREQRGRDVLIQALAGVAEGDRGALREIYDRTAAKLFGICLRICRERSGAEDVLQDVFATVWTRAGSFDPLRASPITWLATIARNKAIDWLRRQPPGSLHVSADHLDDVADPAPEPIELISQVQQAARLRECLETLESRTSAAIRSAFLDGASYPELAEREGMPPGTMKSLIRRGLQRLKACLGDD